MHLLACWVVTENFNCVLCCVYVLLIAVHFTGMWFFQIGRHQATWVQISGISYPLNIRHLFFMVAKVDTLINQLMPTFLEVGLRNTGVGTQLEGKTATV